jgi:rhodanese-related sulfurtransferase
MRTLLLAAALALSAGACKKSASQAPAAAAEVQVPTTTVDAVDRALAQGQCQPVDANGEATRHRMGVLPGAVLLSDEATYKLSELPADKAKPLVFYCANTHCGASHEAAARAITAGYTNVKVMPEGIAGWVKAGKKVQQI